MKEKCKKCGSTDFAIVRDMTSRRKCKCGHEWDCPKRQGLTDWEVAQELIFISDTIGERSADFKMSHPEIRSMLDEARRTIGDKFNRMKTHSFGITSHDEEKK